MSDVPEQWTDSALRKDLQSKFPGPVRIAEYMLRIPAEKRQEVAHAAREYTNRTGQRYADSIWLECKRHAEYYEN